MFIKKIVSWISENPPEGNIDESIMEGSEKSFSEITGTVKNDDNWSSASTGAKTSTLNGSFVQNEIADIHECNEDGENLFFDDDNESRSITTSGNTVGTIQMEAKVEISDHNELARETLPFITHSTANINLIDEVNFKKESICSSTKLSSTTICESQTSFPKKIIGFDHNNASDIRCSRSIYTQTEVGVSKQDDNLIKENSNNYFSFGDQEREKNNQIFPFCESSLANFAEKYRKSERPESLYGTLFVVGCSKIVPSHLTEKMNTKYILRKRAKANGLIEVSNFITSDIEESLSASSAKYIISYPSDRNRSVIVTFKHDILSDLFQIGRYEKYPVDFTVDDTNPFDKARHGVSRFACRISVRRDENREARIYAGAFNSSQIISVGEGLAHDYCGKMDGFTTNGVLILKPNQNCPTFWREVSVSGYIYPLRSSKMSASKRPRISEESNVLIDGTLIDLCGVTLIWRTPEGLKKAPSENYLNHLQSTLHKYVPKCSLFPRDLSQLGSQTLQALKKAYVYLSCGHVAGLALSEPPDNSGKGWSCPECRGIGPIKEFIVGAESGFYFEEDDPPSYAAFKPCGHVASLKTVKFWSSIDIPNHRNIQYSICPFCGQKLNFIIKYVKLILPII